MTKPGGKANQGARVRVLLGSTIALGPGKADLLNAIKASGSISKAAKSMGMSYRRAWLLVDTMNASFVTPLIETSRGGGGGGGASLTKAGEEALARYRAMEDKVQSLLAEDIADFTSLLRPDARELDEG